MLARLLRIASVVICLISVAWFLLFALNQTSSASNHQQAEIYTAPGAPTSNPSTPAPVGGPHKVVNEVFSTLSSPFSGVASGSSEWTIHIVDTLLVLLVYGFGLAFVARLLRLGL
jgi:TRAP-type C4-dicarboxylate transport system permease small subunit